MLARDVLSQAAATAVRRIRGSAVAHSEPEARASRAYSQHAAGEEHAESRLAARAQPTPPVEIDAIRREIAGEVFTSPKTHAAELLEDLQQPDPALPRGWCGREVRASAIEAIYRERCAERGVTALPWQLVGSELRRLIGCGRVYRSFYESGRRQRLCVYPIPNVRAVASVDHTELRAA